MLAEVSALLADSVLLLLLPYLFWGIVFYGAYQTVLLFAEEYRVKRAALEEPHRQLLEERVAYYRQLDEADRKTFEKRVKAFLREKKFVAQGGLIVTDETRLLVAACAVQLTFGFPPVCLARFGKILLYPDGYDPTPDQAHRAGEADAGRIITLSGKRFAEGSHGPDNSCHAGLYDMAHALLLANRIQNQECGFLSDESVEYFFACAEREHGRIPGGRCLPLRDYILTGRAGFFAAAVETFFEEPGEMRTGCPQLYGALVQLLNQNPLERRSVA